MANNVILIQGEGVPYGISKLGAMGVIVEEGRC